MKDQFLQSLPETMKRCADRWMLSILPPFQNLSFHYVAPCVLPDGTSAVLKIGPNEIASEVSALLAFDGLGSVRLLGSDIEKGAMLLERLTPGTLLTTLADDENDEKATEAAAAVMQMLWRPPPVDHHFPTTDDWGQAFALLRERFGGTTGPLGTALFERAESLFQELSASASPPVLLHGDLHHDNILSAERTPWLAIDPKGVVGEPAYEIGAILRNSWADRNGVRDYKRMLERRVHQFADILSMDRTRIRDWGFAQAVLSAIWGVEDNCFADSSLDMAELILAMKVA